MRSPCAQEVILTMPEPLEITFKVGDKQHHVLVKAGDADGAAEARENASFIIDLYAGTAETKKATKPATGVAQPKPPSTPATPAGGAK